MSVLIFLVPLAMIVSGVLTYGLCFAYFQRKWPDLAELHYESDMQTSLLVGVVGGICSPVILVLALYFTQFEKGKYGLKWS